MSKIQNWKQFTTGGTQGVITIKSVLPCQRYKIESNSQQECQWYYLTQSRFYHVKDTKLKAIHNTDLTMIYFTIVGFTMSKIQNWKQFTTLCLFHHSIILSVLPCQRYKIESNSQLSAHAAAQWLSRFYHVKDTKLKAIHNLENRHSHRSIVGFTMSKIQNWKQFTTRLKFF